VLHDRSVVEPRLGDLFPAHHSLAVAGHLVLQQLHEREVLIVLGGRGLVAAHVEVRARRDRRQVGDDVGDEAPCGVDVQMQ